MIGSALGLVGAGVFGLRVLGRGPAGGAIVSPVADDGGVAPALGPAGLAARASHTAERLRVWRGFPLDPADGKCVVLDNFGDCRGKSCERRHQGIDIFGEFGQPIYAMADGVLTERYEVGGPGAGLSGNAWVLTEADGTYFFYAHLSAFAPGLEVGDEVREGWVVGYVGETGNSDDGNPETCNCHLHFEYHPDGGAAVDPLTFFDPPPGSIVY